MADTAGTAPVVDHRTPPRGVLPRHIQTWLMVGLAVAILGIIAFAGQTAPAPPRPTTQAAESVTTSPERLRDYQSRLRVLDERARRDAETPTPAPTAPAQADSGGATAPPPPDPIRDERRRRDYESLFASNVVMSRRPEMQAFVSQSSSIGARSGDAASRPPNIDDVADAVVRATTRYSGATTSAADLATRPAPAAVAPSGPTRPASTGPILSTGPTHRLLEGTVIDTVLTNRLEGSVAAPVNCLVTSPIYSHDGQYVLIPAGSRVLGETRPVQSFGESRLAVAFNRLVLPDGSTYRLDQFVALNEIGEAGLRDQVDQHYRSTFGAAGAVGLITGLAQYLGTSGLNQGDGNRTVVIAGSAGDATAQATAQTLNRFLNRMPTVTIREGHRVKVYLTSDLELPAFESRARSGQPLLSASSEGGQP